MNLASPQYIFFFGIVLVAYFCLKCDRHQNAFLLLANYAFYAYWDWRFLGLIVLSTVVDYLCGGRIHRAHAPAQKRVWLLASFGINLGILLYFKYLNFFLDSLAMLRWDTGGQIPLRTLNLILPIGISFYTFRGLSYIVDIYRGQRTPCPSFVHYAVFVSFFPLLTAGPIARANEMLPTLGRARLFSQNDFVTGLTRFSLGVFKKVMIADPLALYLVDPVFANPHDASAGMLWLALLGYTAQIYADFSGYSSMAIGSARMLGFEIAENFTFPYLAKNIADFWRRWHISLSRFFQDYVYLSLMGRRYDAVSMACSIVLTMLISGLWHGAAWTFVAWGGLHGIYLAVYQVWRIKRKRRGPKSALTLSQHLWAWGVTQVGICLTQIPFRSASFHLAWQYLTGLFGRRGDAVMVAVPAIVWLALGAFFVDHLSGLLMQNNPERKWPLPVHAHVAMSAVMFYLLVVRGAVSESFVYAQF